MNTHNVSFTHQWIPHAHGCLDYVGSFEVDACDKMVDVPTFGLDTDL